MKLTSKFIEIIGEIPRTVEFIDQYYFFNISMRNALIIHGKYMVNSLSALALNYYLSGEMEDTDSYFCYGGLLCLSHAVSFYLFRENIKKTVSNIFNTLATVDALNNYNSKEFLQMHEICSECQVKEKFIGSIVIQIHYVFYTAIMMVTSYFLNQNLLGSAFTFLLISYFNGFIYWQYALAAEEVCPNHQRHLLLNDGLQCMALGFFIQGALFLASLFLETYFGQSIGAIGYSFFENIFLLFVVLHAGLVRFTLPIENKYVTASPLNPVNLIWMFSEKITKMMTQFIRMRSRHRGETFPPLMNFYHAVMNSENKESLIFIFKCIFPDELHSIEKFIESHENQFYSAYFLEKFQKVVGEIDAQYQSPAFQSVKFIYRQSRIAQSVLDHQIALYAQRYKIPKEITVSFIKIFTNPRVEIFLSQLNGRFSALSENVKSIKNEEQQITFKKFFQKNNLHFKMMPDYFNSIFSSERTHTFFSQPGEIIKNYFK